MADGNIDIPPQLNQAEIDEVERRIQAERQSHSSKWIAFVDPNLAREQEWNKSAIAFANYGVKLLTTLNGGAIAFSVSTATFLNTPITAGEFLLCAGIFSLGLLAGFLALIFGFFACSRMAEYHQTHANKIAKRINYDLRCAEDQYTSMVLRKQYKHEPFASDGAEEEMDKENSAYVFWRTAGIISVFFSVASFLAGTITYVLIVSSKV